MRLWVTRPEEDAEGLADALRAEGIGVMVAPLLHLVWLDGPPLPVADAQALLATSGNGVRAFARRNPERHLPLLAVGDATARVGRDAGFAQVHSAGGDVTSLTRLVQQRLDPAAGALLHPAASEVAGDLAAALSDAGFDYRREVVYEARPAEALPEAVATVFPIGGVDGVVVYSPRTGRTLVRLLRDAGLQVDAHRVHCFCLSDAVAESVRPIPWRSVSVAPEPTQPAMLACISAARQP